MWPKLLQYYRKIQTFTWAYVNNNRVTLLSYLFDTLPDYVANVWYSGSPQPMQDALYIVMFIDVQFSHILSVRSFSVIVLCHWRNL